MSTAKGPLESGYVSSTLSDPGKGSVNITPVMISDTVELAHPIRAMRSAVAGTVKVKTINGDTSYLDFLAGERWPMEIVQIFSTGTDAALKTADRHDGIDTPLTGIY
jgi:hypothetical protein